LTLEYFEDKKMKKIPAYGALPVSVPGCVDGWFEMHKKFGNLPMSDILQPAVDYGRKGFPVTEYIAYYMQRGANLLKGFKNFPETYMPNGRAPRKGEIFKNPNLANTLEKIGKGGRDAFYKGDIAKTMVIFKIKADFYPWKIWQIILRNGLNRFLPTTVDMMFGNSHRMDKEQQCYKFSIFWNNMILLRWDLEVLIIYMF